VHQLIAPMLKYKARLVPYLKHLNGSLDIGDIGVDVPLDRRNVDGLADRPSHWGEEFGRGSTSILDEGFEECICNTS